MDLPPHARAQVAANVVNFACVLALVSSFGVRGTAAATVAAQWFAALTNLFLLVRRGALQRPHLLSPPAWATAAPLVQAGGLLSVRMFCLLAVVGLATSSAARLGTVALAAHEISRQCWLMFAMALESLAISGQVLVARALGAGDFGQARGLARRLFGLSLASGCALGLAMLAASPHVANLFTGVPAVAALVATVLPIVACMQPVGAIVSVMDGILIGSRDNGFVAASTSLAALVTLGVLYAQQFGGPGGLVGVWFAMQFLSITRTATHLTRLRMKGLL